MMSGISGRSRITGGDTSRGLWDRLYILVWVEERLSRVVIVQLYILT